MKQYIQYFKWFFVTIAIIVVIFVGFVIVNGKGSEIKERTNKQTETTERVFDYGGVLSIEEEDKLRALIADTQMRTASDIVIVTLEESLEQYVSDREVNVPVNEYVRIFAEDFYDQHKFGYNVLDGDGIILVDNWFREKDGKAYTWVSTAGKAVEVYDQQKVDTMLDKVYAHIESNPYKAYEAYVKTFRKDMKEGLLGGMDIPFWASPLIAMVCALIFIASHWGRVGGTKTTTAVTYVNGGEPLLHKNEDILYDKKVISRKIETQGAQAGSGGGGGGGSHGGGGRGR